MLTGYDGNTITSDTIGNMLSDGTRTYTWKQGRQLATMSDGTTTWTYTYNADGLRTKRTNGTKTYSYVYNGSQLSQMTVDGSTAYFTYDATGKPMTMRYNGESYLYITNMQGDVIAISGNLGNLMVYYTYDAWGNLLSVTGNGADTIGVLNPLRYRGYVYDSETGLYYVSSRYYNAEIGRFINADTLAILTATPMGFTDKNLFAYCDNNPVIRVDSSGEFWNVVIGAAVGFAVNFISTIVVDLASEGEIDWGGAFISAGIGAVEGALIALCPAAGAAISAGAGALDAAIDGVRDGDSVEEIVIETAISGGIGAVAGAGGSNFVKGGYVNDGVKAVGKVMQKGVHPVVKKVARKTAGSVKRQIVKAYMLQQFETVANGGLNIFTSWYLEQMYLRR